ncbi:ATP-binding protein, partial [Acinetobacter baumannii]
GADKGKRVGLVICKTIVEHYGGKIWVESTLGKGSTFYFSLDKSSLKNNGELNSGYTSIDELQRGQMLILSA